jgi:hypothetical protein
MTPPQNSFHYNQNYVNVVAFCIHSGEQNNTAVIFVVIKIRSTSGGFHCANVFPVYRASTVAKIPAVFEVASDSYLFYCLLWKLDVNLK